MRRCRSQRIVSIEDFATTIVAKALLHGCHYVLPHHLWTSASPRGVSKSGDFVTQELRCVLLLLTPPLLLKLLLSVHEARLVPSLRELQVRQAAREALEVGLDLQDLDCMSAHRIPALDEDGGRHLSDARLYGILICSAPIRHLDSSLPRLCLEFTICIKKKFSVTLICSKNNSVVVATKELLPIAATSFAGVFNGAFGTLQLIHLRWLHSLRVRLV
mmetsp:Transcript_19159/g.44789  ORF Transcript_19159/g.44789 Transcript_19159/m.44789 type:complete len:217 (-) Transcript_19159:521-1171(-)